MKKSRLLGVVCALTSVFTTPPALSITIDTYIGYNYISSDVYFTAPPNDPVILEPFALDTITYQGAGGTFTTESMTNTMLDGSGLAAKPTPTYVYDSGTGTGAGDGQSTRTFGTSLPINWVDAGVTTPWGGSYSFPTINITSISAHGYTGDLTTASQYVVGLIPLGSNTELDSLLGGSRSDIYDNSRIVAFSTDPLSGITGTGEFIFSAAEAPPVPVPAAVWLFGSGLLGLIGMARRKQSA